MNGDWSNSVPGRQFPKGGEEEKLKLRQGFDGRMYAVSACVVQPGKKNAFTGLSPMEFCRKATIKKFAAASSTSPQLL